VTAIMTRRRQADDLQALLDGRRPRSAAAADQLAPLVALATSITPDGALGVRPRAAFRDDLRDRLLAEAAVRVPAPRAAQPVEAVVPRTRHRVRRAVAALALTALAAGAGTAAASTRALPGDALYGVKRQVEAVQLALAHGDLGKGRELLEQADTRLGEAEALAAGEDSAAPQTRARLADALTDMAAATRSATGDLTEAYDETGDPEPLELLSRFTAQQQERLDDLMTLLDPALRAQVRGLAASLAQIQQRVDALLGTTVSGAAPAATGDSVRRGDRGGSGGAGGGPGLPEAVGGATSAATATGSGAGAGSTGVGSTGSVGSVVDGVVGAVGGATGAGGSTSSPTGGTGGGVSAGTASVPLPTVSAVPLPTSSPLVSDPVSAVTSAVPQPLASALPSVSACVPVPPLTAC
jgi:hypothetical protein